MFVKNLRGGKLVNLDWKKIAGSGMALLTLGTSPHAESATV